MEHQTSHLDLERDGWALLVNDKKESLHPKTGDLVKIGVETVSPLDYESGGEIRSVSHITLWVEIEKKDGEGYIGIFKTKPGHDLHLKDGSMFEIGDRIFFKQENILSIRGLGGLSGLGAGSFDD